MRSRLVPILWFVAAIVGVSLSAGFGWLEMVGLTEFAPPERFGRTASLDVVAVGLVGHALPGREPPDRRRRHGDHPRPQPGRLWLGPCSRPGLRA